MARRLAGILLALLAIVAVAAAAPAMAISPVPTPMVFFSPGSSEIKPQAVAALKAAVRGFQRRPDQSLVLTAHTDSAEARSSSIALSPARGEAVKKRLVEMGVPADRIEIWVFGDSRPLAIVPPGAAEPQNRRVEIVVLSAKQ